MRAGFFGYSPGECTEFEVFVRLSVTETAHTKDLGPAIICSRTWDTSPLPMAMVSICSLRKFIAREAVELEGGLSSERVRSLREIIRHIQDLRIISPVDVSDSNVHARCGRALAT